MATAASAVITLTEANFAEVVGRSRQVPVLVDFWADWCAPCKQIAPVLEKLATEWSGRVIVAKVNADQEPLITQQFGVRGLPTLKLVFQGQLAGELVGAHPESAIRKLVAPFLDAGDEPLPEEGDVPDFHGQVQSAIADGYIEDAVAALQAQLGQQPDDKRSRAMLGELLVSQNRLDEAATVLAEGGDAPELRRVRAQLGFARRIDGLPSLESLESAMQGGAGSEERYRYALRLVGANRFEDGMDHLLQLMKSDRAWGEDAARKALIDIFEMLGREDPLTVAFRRRMASLLY